MGITAFALIMDVLGTIVLVAVVFQAIRLNRHFSVLQKQREELAHQLSVFAESTRRAEQVVAMVKATTAENATLIERQIRRAEVARGDLERTIGGSGAAVRADDPVADRDRRSGRVARQSLGADVARDGSKNGSAGLEMDPSDGLKALRRRPVMKPAAGGDAGRGEASEAVSAPPADPENVQSHDANALRARLRAARAGGSPSVAPGAPSGDSSSASTAPPPQRSRSELIKALQGMR